MYKTGSDFQELNIKFFKQTEVFRKINSIIKHTDSYIIKLCKQGVQRICIPQSLDPICGIFDKFLAHGQAHMGEMGKWLWQCTTTGLDNSTELWVQ